jgi:hypothetical protein
MMKLSCVCLISASLVAVEGFAPVARTRVIVSIVYVFLLRLQLQLQLKCEAHGRNQQFSQVLSFSSRRQQPVLYLSRTGSIAEQWLTNN